VDGRRDALAESGQGPGRVCVSVLRKAALNCAHMARTLRLGAGVCADGRSTCIFCFYRLCCLRCVDRQWELASDSTLTSYKADTKGTTRKQTHTSSPLLPASDAASEHRL